MNEWEDIPYILKEFDYLCTSFFTVKVECLNVFLFMLILRMFVVKSNFLHIVYTLCRYHTYGLVKVRKKWERTSYILKKYNC